MESTLHSIPYSRDIIAVFLLLAGKAIRMMIKSCNFFNSWFFKFKFEKISSKNFPYTSKNPIFTEKQR